MSLSLVFIDLASDRQSRGVSGAAGHGAQYLCGGPASICSPLVPVMRFFRSPGHLLVSGSWSLEHAGAFVPLPLLQVCAARRTLQCFPYLCSWGHQLFDLCHRLAGLVRSSGECMRRTALTCSTERVAIVMKFCRFLPHSTPLHARTPPSTAFWTPMLFAKSSAFPGAAGSKATASGI